MNSHRIDVRLPEAEQHSAPVELTCVITGQPYAFEHTGIEPFGGQIKSGLDSKKLFDPIVDRLVGRLPTDSSFELYVPAEATKGLRPKRILRIQESLISWITENAIKCPVARMGRILTPILSVNLEGVPFAVSLHRSDPLGPEYAGHLDVKHVVQGDLEEKRYERILKAYEAKRGKLAAWKRDVRARTVLVLEENDIQLTDHWAVAQAVKRIELTDQDKPDCVFMVSTYLPNRWWVIPIRIGSEFYELDGRDKQLLEVDSSTLTSITLR